MSETEALNVGEFDQMMYMKKRKVLSLLPYLSLYPEGVPTHWKHIKVKAVIIFSIL